MMGFGLMGAGAAVKGLVGGYQQGRRFAREEDEADRQTQRFEMEKEKFGLDKKAAEQAGRLREAQITGAGILNRKAQGELDDAEYNRGVEEVGVEIARRAMAEAYGSAPAVDNPTAVPAPANLAGLPPVAEGQPARTYPVSGGAAPAPVAGIRPPGAATVPEGGEAPTTQPATAPRGRLEVLAGMNRDLINNQLRKRGVDRGALLRQAVESARFFARAETQLTMDAMQQIQAGVPQERVLANLEAQGVPVKPGTTFALVQGKDEQTGAAFTDVQINVPGAAPVSQRALSRAMLDPKDLFSLETELGKLNATVSHHKAMETLAREANEDKRRSYAEQMKRLDAQIAQQAATFRLQEAGFQWNKFTSMKDSAEKSFARTFNYTPPNDVTLDKLRDQDIKEPLQGMSRVDMALERASKAGGDVTMAMLTWSVNLDPKTMKPNATEAEVVSALKRVAADREGRAAGRIKSDAPSPVKYDDLNRAFVDVGGTKVILPMTKPGEKAPEPQGRADRARGAGVTVAPGLTLSPVVPGR